MHHLSSTQARKLFKQGKLVERSGDLESARKLYTEALLVDPDTSQADWDMLQNPRSFPERRAIRAMLRTRIADFTWSSYQESKAFRDLSFEPKVFMYWGQGFDKAPPIVQASVRAAQRHHEKSQLILLDDSNLHDWATLPDRVWTVGDKYRAAFSDILRIELIANHGGIWADATCYPTSNLIHRFDEMVAPAGFFVFGKNKPGVISNWFLASKPHSYIACMIRDSMRLFWDVFEKPITYYHMHQIWLQLYRMDDRFAAHASRIPDLEVDPRAINRAMLEELANVNVDTLLAGSFVHKLTHKYPPELATPSTVASHMASL